MKKTNIHEVRNNHEVTIIEGVDYKVEATYDGISVWLLTSNKAFREESIFMENCVGKMKEEKIVQDLDTSKEGRHFKAYQCGLRLMYSFRDPLDQNKPVATLGLKRKTSTLPYRLGVIRGPSNKPVDKKYWNACCSFIEELKNTEVYKPVIRHWFVAQMMQSPGNDHHFLD